MSNTHFILPFIAYFCILLTIGLISHRRQRSAADFIVGNRSLNFWVTALSAHASDMSSWLFMAFPAGIYMGGLSKSWTAVGLMFGMFLNWQFVATKLRVLTEEYQSYTLSTFFERRFKDDSGIIRILTAFVAVFFFTCYVAAGLIGMGEIFVSVFGVNFYVGLTISSLVVLVYTFIGGFITVAWTDMFQALFLICMIALVPYMAYNTLDGGWSSIVSAAEQQGISLELVPDASIYSVVAIIFLMLEWGLGYFGQPHIITKFMGIKDSTELNKSKYLGMTWQFLALTGAAFIGLVGIAYFKTELQNPEHIFIEMVKALFHPLAAGFVLCGVIAASLSTMDSQILVSASMLSEDFYKHFLKKQATQKELLIASRAGVVLVSVVSLLLALNRNSTIQQAVLYAWSGLGCSFGPLVLMSLYSTSTNRYGAIAGVIVGSVIAATWDNINPYVISYKIPAMIAGFSLSLITIYVVSKVTGRAYAKE